MGLHRFKVIANSSCADSDHRGVSSRSKEKRLALVSKGYERLKGGKKGR